MKTPKPLGLTLAGLMLMTSATGVLSGVKPAQANDNDYFQKRVKKTCQRVNNGYFCQDNRFERRGSNGRFERSRGGFGRGGFGRSTRRSDRDFSNRRFQTRAGRIFEGATIRTRTFDNDRIRIRRGDSQSLTLVVDQDVRSDVDNFVLIPRGSRIVGRLRPNDGGVRYVADDIYLPNGRRYDLDARSETIFGRNRSGRRISNSAANVILGSILTGRDSRAGDIFRRGDILTRSRNRRFDDYISINPSRDLDLRLTDDFRIRD